MTNLFKKIAILGILCFSIYCFCFINSQDTLTNPAARSTALTTQDIEPEQKQNDTYFPDLALVERVASVISQVMKVF